MTREELRGAVARGWTHDANRFKTFDIELASAIAEEVHKVMKSESLNEFMRVNEASKEPFYLVTFRTSDGAEQEMSLPENSLAKYYNIPMRSPNLGEPTGEQSVKWSFRKYVLLWANSATKRAWYAEVF